MPTNLITFVLFNRSRIFNPSRDIYCEHYAAKHIFTVNVFFIIYLINNNKNFIQKKILANNPKSILVAQKGYSQKVKSTLYGKTIAFF